MQPPPQRHYLSLCYGIPEEHYEQAYAALSNVERLGITEGDDEITICILHTGEEGFQNATERHIMQLFQQFTVQAEHYGTETIVEENWNKVWEDSIEPVWVNERIVITPSWKQDTVSAPIVVVINPQMSFGTGHHETTRMTANLLEQCVQAGSTWIDAGTGTGILAILAIKCGATTVIAFDNDEWSVLNTSENFELNFISLNKNISVFQSDVNNIVLQQCNGLTANLHKNLLSANLPRFHNALAVAHGDLLISGLLKYDHDTIVRRATECGFTHQRTSTDGEWIALHFTA
jgi:ribosomal protein L11 methyltransferase